MWVFSSGKCYNLQFYYYQVDPSQNITLHRWSVFPKSYLGFFFYVDILFYTSPSCWKIHAIRWICRLWVTQCHVFIAIDRSIHSSWGLQEWRIWYESGCILFCFNPTRGKDGSFLNPILVLYMRTVSCHLSAYPFYTSTFSFNMHYQRV